MYIKPASIATDAAVPTPGTQLAAPETTSMAAPAKSPCNARSAANAIPAKRPKTGIFFAAVLAAALPAAFATTFLPIFLLTVFAAAFLLAFLLASVANLAASLALLNLFVAFVILVFWLLICFSSAAFAFLSFVLLIDLAVLLIFFVQPQEPFLHFLLLTFWLRLFF